MPKSIRIYTLEDTLLDIEIRSLNYWITGIMPSRGSIAPELAYDQGTEETQRAA